MNAATHYPMLAAQAAAHELEVLPSTTVEADRGRTAFLESIKAGINSGMPLGMNTRSYKVSQHLGECGRDAQAFLFSACHAALADRTAEEVKARLLAFVHGVAREYGEDSADFWCDR